MQSDDAALAYCAGLFDAEGSITVYGKPKRPVLRFVMGSEDAVRHFHDVLGIGSVKEQRPKPPRRPVWRWYRGGEDNVVPVLTRLRPFLINQREQLRLLDEFMAALHPEDQERILNKLKSIRRRYPYSRQQKQHELL